MIESLIRIMTGGANVYLIKGEAGLIMVDAGQVRGIGTRAIGWTMQRHGITPKDIVLIIVTHAHFDHVGALWDIQQASGAPILAHAAEADLLEQGTVVVPPGTTGIGRAVHKIGVRAAALGLLDFKPVHVTIPISEGLPVDKWGLYAQVIHTPGHTAGSLSLLCANGNAFVGDLATHYFPGGHGPVTTPNFAADPAALTNSRRALLDHGAKRIYPGHGFAFDAVRLAPW